MWQKTRSIWVYIHEHYMDDYEFFHLGGDDMYVMVENLKHFLSQVQASTPPNTPLYLGQWVSQPGGTYMVSGGPGYTLNAAAIKRLVEEALPECHATREAPYEDRLLSTCLGALNVTGSDTRDVETGEQQYHDTTPAQLYTFRSRLGRRINYHARIAVYWEGLPHPSRHQNQTVGPKHGLEAAATYSVSFHDLYKPQYVARIHALVYRNLCPAHSPLGRGLRKHVQMVP
jgi:glycoprotein-N-acetylgalactosamine 3-beta-galactosyltransferase